MDSVLPSASQRSSLERATALYASKVDLAASYLAGRGVTEEGAHSFRLGYVEEPATPEHERFVGWVSIPYLTVTGVVAIKFRRVDDGSPKYDAPGGQKAHLYNARVLAEAGDVVAVVEGEFDALLATQDIIPAVGTPGVTWLPHWPRCFASFDRVIVVGDNDVKEDGSNPGLKHAKKVQASLPGSELILPPPGLDISEWINEHGAEAVREGLGL